MNRACTIAMAFAVLALGIPSCGWRMPRDHPGPYARLANTFCEGSSEDRTWILQVTRVNGRKLSPFFFHAPPDGLPSKGWLEEVIPAGRPIMVRIKGEDTYDSMETTNSVGEFGVLTLIPELIHDAIDAKKTPKHKTVEGDVTFTPAPNGHYTITGKLGFERSAIWIEDSSTGRLMGRKVTTTQPTE